MVQKCSVCCFSLHFDEVFEFGCLALCFCPYKAAAPSILVVALAKTNETSRPTTTMNTLDGSLYFNIPDAAGYLKCVWSTTENPFHLTHLVKRVGRHQVPQNTWFSVLFEPIHNMIIYKIVYRSYSNMLCCMLTT